MGYDKNQLHYVTATVIIVKDEKFLIAKRAEWEKAFPESGLFLVASWRFWIMLFVRKILLCIGIMLLRILLKEK